MAAGAHVRKAHPTWSAQAADEAELEANDPGVDTDPAHTQNNAHSADSEGSTHAAHAKGSEDLNDAGAAPVQGGVKVGAVRGRSRSRAGHRQASTRGPRCREPSPQRVKKHEEAPNVYGSEHLESSGSVKFTRTGRRRSRSRGPSTRGRRLVSINPKLYRSSAPSPRQSRTSASRLQKSPRTAAASVAVESDICDVAPHQDPVLNRAALETDSSTELIKRVSFAAQP
eukprot:CAMPEP_0185831204 /NCGR_PEP_ID=MMETSP1353-20130828/1344_1 /TAXON_ID=1077150 /ORGANISM="Erythrolobus australicus, Strain CCMP3124" /LENGTH=226 /DNA_ID=CAMNT_0028529241 /DNA_START=212 /DNA_END=893 /DNA_ORIENTATION=-